MHQCGLDHHIIKSDTDQRLLGFPASQQKIIRSAKQNYLFFFAEVIIQLARFSQCEYLTKDGKIQIYKIIKTNSRYKSTHSTKLGLM
jgi:hypothetical protein